MKQSAIIGLLIFSQILICSCIYESPKGDEFFRTLWTSEEAPLGAITLEFLCESNISIKGNGAVGSYGTYQTSGTTAYFSSLKLHLDLKRFTGTGHEALNSINTDPMDKVTIIIEEGHRTDDRLSIKWHFSGSDISYSTNMTRRSSYR